MPVSAPRPARLSKEEWLELEKQSGLRYEYLDGFVYAMAEESRTHNDIVVNITLALAQKARAKGCEFQVENMRTWVKALNRYYYPDVVISCGTEAHESEIHEPCFIVEVLSESVSHPQDLRAGLAGGEAGGSLSANPLELGVERVGQRQ